MRSPDSAGLSTPAVRLFETGSTSADALERARAGESGPLWIVADRQTAGRGRRGRGWTSEPGNLHASLLLTDPSSATASPQLCFVAGVALHDAVAQAAALDRRRLGLKWPNDLMLDGAKCAGILVEGETTGDRLAAVIGFGVNCAHHPADLPYPATDLATAGAPLAPAALLAALDDAVASRLAEWNRGAGFPAIREAWLARAIGVGGRLGVTVGDRKIEGTFEALDDNGALVLRRPDGARHVVSAGDVAVVAPAEARP